MKSSYNSNLTYKELLECILFLKNPKKVIEFGILEGFSLEVFASKKDCQIEAYDIFDDFEGSRSSKGIIQKFENHKNVSITYGDFYKKFLEIEDNSVDIIHIDIANNGNVYQFAIENYMKKLKNDGLLILEGGSEERDEVEWMEKFNKRKIKPYLESLDLEWKTIGNFPSITLVTKS